MVRLAGSRTPSNADMPLSSTLTEAVESMLTVYGAALDSFLQHEGYVVSIFGLVSRFLSNELGKASTNATMFARSLAQIQRGVAYDLTQVYPISALPDEAELDLQPRYPNGLVVHSSGPSVPLP